MIALVLRNDEEAVFSASAATEGGHGSVAHLPGAALWGAVAAHIYGAGNDRLGNSFDVIHSGKVRISPGFPVTHTGAPAFPLPQTFQGPKHEIDKGILRFEQGDRHFGELSLAMRNSLRPEENETRRVPLDVPKGWYVAADGSMVKPDAHERGKAATEEGSRRVARSQFFQYEHLDTHQEWLVWIEGDDPAVEAVVAGHLTAQPLGLGRSKRREYGGAFSARREENWCDPRARQFEGEAKGELVLWCLSDLALVDEFGTPNLAPEPENFGIAAFSGKLDKARSAINTRRYAPFNNFLGARDREHAVIAAGSVLFFHLDAPLDLSAFKQGVGIWRERGLGLVWPDAPMLLVARPLEAIDGDALHARIARPLPRNFEAALVPLTDVRQSALFENLKAYADDHSNARRIATMADELKRKLTNYLKAAESRGTETPGPSQWSLVAAKANAARTVEALHDALFRDDQNAERGCCVGPANRDWQAIREQLQRLVKEQYPLPRDGVFLRAFARAARALGREWRPRKERS